MVMVVNGDVLGMPKGCLGRAYGMPKGCLRVPVESACVASALAWWHDGEPYTHRQTGKRKKTTPATAGPGSVPSGGHMEEDLSLSMGSL